MQLAISLAQPFRMNLGTAWEEYQAVLIKPDFQHECVLEDKQVIFLGIDAESEEAARLSVLYLQEDGYYKLPDTAAESFIKDIITALHPIPDPVKVSSTVKSFLENLLSDSVHSHQIDARLLRIMEYIRQSMPRKLKLRELSSEACLSEGRLVHLFKEQLGIPLRAYIAWTRINAAVFAIANGASLTEAAHASGFADSAHFSRVFARTFGMPPSGLLKNSQNLQAFLCKE